ncbi:MAG: sulfotransferase [Anaerolineae bacterium]|nr:sulfotransferase [Anaerolineae bacterium]
MQDPLIIGAIGGSGTRVLQCIAAHAGYFMGTHLTRHKDALPIQQFCRQHARRWLVTAGQNPPPAETIQQLEQWFAAAVREHLAALPNPDGLWGFKVPKSIHLLPFWDHLYPHMRFIHVLRSGLDIAYSRNWRLEGERQLILEEAEKKWPPHRQAIVLWGRVNEAAAEYGAERLGSRYLCIRFEDLCARPKEVTGQILDFVGQDRSSLEQAAAEVVAPPSIGRWRQQRLREIHDMMKAGRSSLERFGYWNPANWREIDAAAHAPLWQRWAFRRRRMRDLPAL